MRRASPLLAVASHRPRELGDSFTLDNGIRLTLVYCEDMVPVFRAEIPGAAKPEMWTEHMDRPGLYLKICEWPHGPRAVFNPEEAVDLALTAQLIFENFIDLDAWAPVEHVRATGHRVHA